MTTQKTQKTAIVAAVGFLFVLVYFFNSCGGKKKKPSLGVNLTFYLKVLQISMGKHRVRTWAQASLVLL